MLKRRKPSKKEKADREKEISNYFADIKDASIFLDKSILTLSSAFLWFLFTQLNTISESSLQYWYYLNISIIFLWITILLVLLSYIITIYHLKTCMLKKWKIRSMLFFIFKVLEEVLRIAYIISFIIPVSCTILFYLHNLN